MPGECSRSARAGGGEGYADTATVFIFARTLCSHPGRPKDCAIIGHCQFTERLKDRGHAFGCRIALPPQVEIAGTPIWDWRREGEQHRAPRDELVAAARLREAIDQTLNREAGHDELRILISLAGLIRQARPHRCPDLF